MLAQNFKTAADLGITDAEFNALAKVLGMLERGELKAHDARDVQAWQGNAMPTYFNMVSWNSLADCGTVCCIGGAAEYVGGFETAHFHHNNNFRLRQLLGIDGGSLLTVRPATPEQAAIALRNYLTCGEARWAEALAA